MSRHVLVLSSLFRSLIPRECRDGCRLSTLSLVVRLLVQFDSISVGETKREVAHMIGVESDILAWGACFMWWEGVLCGERGFYVWSVGACFGRLWSRHINREEKKRKWCRVKPRVPCALQVPLVSRNVPPTRGEIILEET